MTEVNAYWTLKSTLPSLLATAGFTGVHAAAPKGAKQGTGERKIATGSSCVAVSRPVEPVMEMHVLL